MHTHTIIRLTLRATALLLVLTTCLPDRTKAASALPKPVAATLATSFPKPHLRFKERKGTMGFVYAAVLGPIGYFGVRIFSPRNEQMRYQAGRGFKFWGYLVASCALIGVCAALGDNGNAASSVLPSLWAGF